MTPAASPGEDRATHRSGILGWIRLAAVYAFIAALVYVSRPTPALTAAGVLFALGGEAVRLWAAGHLTKSVRLITSGPYAYTQNPLYLGRLMILTGLAIAARTPGYLNLVALALGYGVFFLYYIPRKLRVEGGRLARLHRPSPLPPRPGGLVLRPHGAQPGAIGHQRHRAGARRAGLENGAPLSGPAVGSAARGGISSPAAPRGRLTFNCSRDQIRQSRADGA